jgi:hypothetical protein
LRYQFSLKKVSVVTIGFVVAISLLGWYIVPHFFFCYASGIVEHKKIGYTLDGNLKVATYTVSIHSYNDDAINNFSSGITFAYSLSKFDWDIVQSGDTVRIKILPDLSTASLS